MALLRCELRGAERTGQLPNDTKAAKRAFGRLEGVNDPSHISPISRFLAGGVGGVVSQCVSAFSDEGKISILINLAGFLYTR